MLRGRVVSAQRLREAAKVLRERAEETTPGPWSTVAGASNVWRFPDQGTPTVVVSGNGAHGHHVKLTDAEYIATMHPDVGLALADALEQLADERDLFGHPGPKTIDNNALVRVADLILGGD